MRTTTNGQHAGPRDGPPTRAVALRANLRTAGAMRANLASRYLVKGWLDQGAASVFYGPPGTGKSFVALDLALHVAAGVSWHGAKVRPASATGVVAYVASEGGGGFENRVVAWIAEHPEFRTIVADRFVLLTLPVDLCRSADARALVAALAAYPEISLVIIDTLARAMGGGDENNGSDMGAFVQSIDEIRDATGAHVMVVHHTGKDSARGARGHSSLRGAVDTEIEAEAGADGMMQALTRKQRDMPAAGRKFAYRLQQYELGRDTDGDPVTTCVVEKLGEADAQKRDARASESRLNERQRNALDALRDTCARSGTLNVCEADWRDEFYRRAFTAEDSAEVRKKAFQRARGDLKKRNLIGQYAGDFWTVYTTGTAGT